MDKLRTAVLPSKKTKTIFFCLTLLLALSLLFSPSAQAIAHAQSGDVIHVVKPGENLSRIAAHYGVSYVRLARYNGIVNPNLVRPGQALRIPIPSTPEKKVPKTKATPTPKATQLIATKAPSIKKTAKPTPRPVPAYVAPARCGEVTYTVRIGDSINGIAARFGIAAYSLRQRNNLRSNVIYVGQSLIIPLGHCSATSTPTAAPRSTASSRPTSQSYRPTPTRPSFVRTALPTSTPRILIPSFFPNR